ncbi:MAG: TRAP transporter solute receptor, unknown substrate 6 [uncultured Microvirga sp.]|uniref:TRAP-type C4-dicarboxylate transport system, periplasmic component n=1 Tax=uncultured Microvirga sp. TaxID=412392 RepID=A0A6J4LLZ1_9HYPH|nr:MAG: TRAP transporter solute receptor, unknown substrate 6 [uncultured Microvirga sp.]
MERRTLLKAGALAGAVAFPMPAIAQAQPQVSWRLASSYPKSLDTLWGASPHIAKRVAAATDGKFQIQPFAAGEIVGGAQVLDAVQAGTVECGHTLSNFYVGKDPTFAFDSCLPFGLNARQQNAWMQHGGGLALIRDLMKEYNVYNIPAGNTGAQMGGWFRKEINTLADLQGLKMRIPGIAGQMMARLGVVPQQLAGGDVYPSLERGTIDAAEWSGPYDDEKLGFVKIAKYYYYPGFWEGGAQVSLLVNQERWNALPESYKAVLEAACAEANGWMVAKYDAENPDALRRLVAAGAQLKPFSREIMEAAHKQAFALYDELSAKNERFKRVYAAWKEFRDKEVTWFRIGELPFDYFVQTQAAQRP